MPATNKFSQKVRKEHLPSTGAKMRKVVHMPTRFDEKDLCEKPRKKKLKKSPKSQRRRSRSDSLVRELLTDLFSFEPKPRALRAGCVRPRERLVVYYADPETGELPEELTRWDAPQRGIQAVPTGVDEEEEKEAHLQAILSRRDSSEKKPQIPTPTFRLVSTGVLQGGVSGQTMLYGAETWALTKSACKRLATAQRKTERRMVGVRLVDKKTNDWLRGVTKISDVAESAKKRKMKYAWKLANEDEEKWSKRLTDWRPIVSRPLGRPRTRWRDDIRKALRTQAWQNQARRTTLRQWLNIMGSA